MWVYLVSHHLLHYNSSPSRLHDAEEFNKNYARIAARMLLTGLLERYEGTLDMNSPLRILISGIRPQNINEYGSCGLYVIHGAFSCDQGCPTKFDANWKGTDDLRKHIFGIIMDNSDFADDLAL